MIDLRSDTVTRPTEEMRRAMAAAEVGDDVYGEDPTVRALEEEGAGLLGKEAGLFVASGTMGNLVALLTHTRRGDEVIGEAGSHTMTAEVGGMAALGGLMPRAVATRDGLLTAEDLQEAVRPPNLHFPPARLLCLENTHNAAGGVPFSSAQLRPVCTAARSRGLAIHLDGARLFNAAVALGEEARRLAEPVDTVMVCLSKGLAAPVGSLLAGPREWVREARRYRKMVGGGMRQAGVLAAAGLVALRTMIDRLAEDHANARYLAEGLAAMPEFAVDPPPRTNIVMTVSRKGTAWAARLTEELERLGVRVALFGPARLRWVTHKDVSRADVEKALELVRQAVRLL